MHEVVLSASNLKRECGVTALDVSKRLIATVSTRRRCTSLWSSTRP